MMTVEKDLQTLQRQFLCCYPLNFIDCKPLSNLSWHYQKQLLDFTYNNDLNKKYPINNNYQLRFFKKLINILEQSAEEIHDELYEAFCKLNSAGTNDNEKFSFKHYSLPHYDTIITLKESKSFVADGTTGLCSWQASLALADWLLHNPNVVQDKSVIELGSGTGLCGFIISKCCKAKEVILTDGSPKVIDILNTNRDLNFSETNPSEKCSILELPWEECELIGTKKFDVILAADVVYDSTEFDSLVGAIVHLFELMDNKVHMILAATVRNEATLKMFLSLLDSRKFNVEDKEVVAETDSYLFWDRSTPIRIMKITKNTNLS
ncbi:protein-lysine N-methyltransferase EEF2KMT [Episyrphus balteatus]|uniref:protein-lysine N-methyltransferase EEF2KMT n=1 Tax=Episyrphus balteatus TaxID=286459 RepID=UPI002485FAC5|nr:protein-lysine N-methyltransferase EEF2KMT [Episyrphus balteatus]